MTRIETKNAPGAIGPYSQGYIANGFELYMNNHYSVCKRYY